MLPDKYVYISLSLSLLLILFAILIVRRDLRKPALIAGFCGGLAGFLAEVFYSRDYWTAPTLFGVETISLDNFLFGFSITAFCVVLYPYLSKAFYVNSNLRNSMPVFFSLFAASLAGLIMLIFIFKVNSVIASSTIFILDAIFLWWKDRSLIRQSLITAAIVTPLLFLIYLVIGIMAPEYLEKYWHLYHTSLGVRIFTHVPLLELFWYFSWALFGSIGYRFLFTKELASIDRS